MIGIRITSAIVVILIGALAYSGWRLTARGGYESAEYSVVQTDGAFEIREYADLMMVTTDMKRDSQGDDGSFMRLFEYISGANDGEQRVAMTTPVFMESDTDGTQGQMRFVIPKELANQRIPEPSNDKVRICKRTSGRFAVLRFAGRMSKESVRSAEEDLRNWISDRELIIAGDVEFAGYDPPWTPGSLRRNEVLIRLK